MIRLQPVARATAMASLALFAAHGHALDLMDSYLKALGHDPTIRAAGEAAAAGRELAVQGDALLKPRVSLSVGASRIDDRSSTPDLPPALVGLSTGNGASTVSQAGVSLVQPIYDARRSAEREQLHQQGELSEISHRHAQQELMQRVSEAYFNVLLAQETLRSVQAEVAAVTMQRDRAQARFDVGRGRVTDLQEAQARLDGVLTREVSAQSTLATRQAQYEALTGLPAAGLAALRDDFRPAPPQPDSLAAWQRRSEENNVRVLAKERELAIAAAETGKHRLSGRPTLDLVAGYGTHHQSGTTSALTSDSHRQATVGVQLNIPLYAGGALDSRERESISRQRQAEQELGAARRDARLAAHDAYLSVKTGVARVASLEQALRSARTALEATTLGRDVGTRTELDVLDAQQRVHAAERDLAQARNEHLLGRVRLALAAGDLQEGELQALNAQLAR